MIDKVKSSCENLRSFLERSGNFSRVGHLQQKLSQEDEFQFDAEHTPPQDRFKNIVSGYYSEEMTFYCTPKGIRAEIKNNFDDNYTSQDEHKLSKAEFKAEKFLNKELYDWVTEDTGYDDLPHLFRIDGKLNKRFSLDTPPKTIEDTSLKVLDGLFRELEKNFFNK